VYFEPNGNGAEPNGLSKRAKELKASLSFCHIYEFSLRITPDANEFDQ